MTGIEVAQNARTLMDQYRYIFGAEGELCSSAHVEELINASPLYFTDNFKKTAARANAGYHCADCSGYVSICCGFSAQSTYSLHNNTAEHRYLAETASGWKANGVNIPIGAVLWKSGHVGIYVGAQTVVEARSEVLNVTMNSLEGRGFEECLLLPGIQYEENTTDALVGVSSISDYIPWLGKIINAEYVFPSATASEGSASSLAGILSNGTQITVIGTSGNYYKIRTMNGRCGYVNAYYVGFLDAAAYDKDYISWNGTVSGANDHVNIRIGPGTSFEQHLSHPQLPNGTIVTVTGEIVSGDDNRLWYHVKFLGIYYGYVRSDLVIPCVVTNYTAWYGKANSTTGTVNIRTEATVNSSLSPFHGALTNGDRVTVVNDTRGSDGYRWYEIEVDGIRAGYCRADLIIPYVEDYYNDWNGEIRTTTGSANIRRGPGTGFSVITGSPYTNGTLVHVVRRHIVGGENRTLISVKTPLRLCRTGTCRKLSAERPQIVVALFERQLVLLLK